MSSMESTVGFLRLRFVQEGTTLSFSWSDDTQTIAIDQQLGVPQKFTLYFPYRIHN